MAKTKSSRRSMADLLGSRELAFLSRHGYCPSLDVVTGQEGEPSAVHIPIDEFARLVGDMEVLAAVASTADADTISLEEMRAELKQRGRLQADH